MARYKNALWALSDPVPTGTEAQLAVLMDLRDELQRLNSLLHCANFTAIPRKLDEIRLNTRKREPKRRVA